MFPREALAAARTRFEQANGNRIQLSEFDEILKHKLSGRDPDEIAVEIKEAIVDEAADAEYRAAAYFVLGGKFDEALIPFFNERLKVELAAREANACYQIMIALDSLDVDVFAPDRDGSVSVNESDLNLRDAQTYLAALDA